MTTAIINGGKAIHSAIVNPMINNVIISAITPLINPFSIDIIDLKSGTMINTNISIAAIIPATAIITKCVSECSCEICIRVFAV